MLKSCSFYLATVLRLSVSYNLDDWWPEIKASRREELMDEILAAGSLEPGQAKGKLMFGPAVGESRSSLSPICFRTAVRSCRSERPVRGRSSAESH